MPDYASLKAVHMVAAALSIAGFTLRYAWMIAGSPLLAARPTKVVPHVVDSMLLLSAVWLAAIAGIAPWAVGWLGFKVIALVAYIVLGTIGLKRGRTRGVRIAAGALAIAVFASIVWAAQHKAVPFAGAFQTASLARDGAPCRVLRVYDRATGPLSVHCAAAGRVGLSGDTVVMRRAGDGRTRSTRGRAWHRKLAGV